MVIDDEVFLARRLGYGLKPGETLGPDLHKWAVRQIAEVPPLDFYGPDGSSLAGKLPPYAEPITDYGEATRQMGAYWDLERELQRHRAELGDEEYERRGFEEVFKPLTLYPAWREALARSLTAVNGPSPVFEQFWAFWVNHFAVNAEDLTKLLYGPHTRTIRSHMTGKFADMLKDAVLQPAMTFYLDNFLSAGPNSPLGKQGDTINENLARELLELHTMSPAAGYVQDDVLQTADALSGWGFYSGKSDEEPEKNKNTPFGIMFDTRRHEPGSRQILGKTYGKANKGRDQVTELMDDLSVHPATAEFLSWKLVRHFLSDIPPPDSVARVRDVWMDTGGNLVAVHTAVIDEVIAHGPGTTKFTSPTQWLHHLYRTTGIQVPTSKPLDGFNPWIDLLCQEMGEPFAGAPQPNGFSDVQEDWTSKALLERRVRYASIVAIKAPAEGRDHLFNLAARIAGADSELVQRMRSLTSTYAVTLLLSSPQFMKV